MSILKLVFDFLFKDDKIALNFVHDEFILFNINLEIIHSYFKVGALFSKPKMPGVYLRIRVH